MGFSTSLTIFLLFCLVGLTHQIRFDIRQKMNNEALLMIGRYPDKLEQLARTSTDHYSFFSPFFSRQGVSLHQINEALVQHQMDKLGLNMTERPEIASSLLNVSKAYYNKRRSKRSPAIMQEQFRIDGSICRHLIVTRYYAGRLPYGIDKYESEEPLNPKQIVKRDRYMSRVARCKILKANKRERRKIRRDKRRQSRKLARQNKRKQLRKREMEKNNKLRKKRQRKLRKKLRKGIKRAFRNLKNSRKSNMCRKPVRIVLCIDELLMNTRSSEIDILNVTKTYTPASAKELSLEMYEPRCILVKRCSNTTGCCDCNSICTPKRISKKKKTFFKFQRTARSPLLMFEKTVTIEYEEHEKCFCKQIRKPVKYGCIKCEQPFFPTMTETGICYCGCQNTNLKCKAILAGKRRLPPKYLNCLREGDCNMPLCDYGFNHYWKSQGLCPKSSHQTTEVAKLSD